MMKITGNNLFSYIRWEFLLLARYQIVGMSLFIAGFYAAFFYALNIHYDDLIILFVISDPVMMGFMFTGVMVLYDKNQNTFAAALASPQNPGVKLLARGIALTLLALVCSFGIALAGKGFDFHYGFFILAVLLSSFLFYYIGIISLMGVHSYNGFLMRSVVFLFPFFIPLLELGDLYTHPVIYLIPTKAVLVLFQASFEPAGIGDMIYAILYLLISILVTAGYAAKKYGEGKI